MKEQSLRMGCIAVFLLSPVAFTMRGANGPSQEQEGHLSGQIGKITLPSGVTRTLKLEGVGCSARICSRIAIKGKVEHDSIVQTSFETIAAIKDTTANDALFVMKDGSQRRMSLMTDFRVLYLTNSSGAAEKLDLAKVNSIEFLGPSK